MVKSNFGHVKIWDKSGKIASVTSFYTVESEWNDTYRSNMVLVEKVKDVFLFHTLHT